MLKMISDYFLSKSEKNLCFVLLKYEIFKNKINFFKIFEKSI